MGNDATGCAMLLGALSYWGHAAMRIVMLMEPAPRMQRC